MSRYDEVKQTLLANPKSWLITGVAGFIGSNLLEALLKLNQKVTGLDNFSTGYQHNLDEVKSLVSPQQWNNFHFVQGDIRDIQTCRQVCKNMDWVLHQAALGSVPRSIEDPIKTNENNVSGFLNMLVAVRDAKVQRFVYAASSSTYGDNPELPKVEGRIGKPLSPYAITKLVNELYAAVFARAYGLESIGLRYFNVFGPRQDPEGAYAAVIPKWFSALLHGKPAYINGDGETSRDFCYVDNAVQANTLAATTENTDALNQVYNVAFGERTTLSALFQMIRNVVTETRPEAKAAQPTYRDFRPGDVRHSLADISKAQKFLSYEPKFSVDRGLQLATKWYVKALDGFETDLPRPELI